MICHAAADGIRSLLVEQKEISSLFCMEVCPFSQDVALVLITFTGGFPYDNFYHEIRCEPEGIVVITNAGHTHLYQYNEPDVFERLTQDTVAELANWPTQ